MISGVLKVTLKTATDTLVFTSIDPRKSLYKHHPVTKKNFSGENSKQKEFRKLVISTYQFENFAKLQEIMIDHTPITEIVVEGFEEHIYWKVATTLLVKTFIPIKPGDESRVIFSVQLEKEDLSDIYTTDILTVE